MRAFGRFFTGPPPIIIIARTIGTSHAVALYAALAIRAIPVILTIIPIPNTCRMQSVIYLIDIQTDLSSIIIN